MRREHNARAWLAYHVAALQRSKTMPPLRKLMLREPRRAPASWQQMKATAQLWAMLGGGVKKGTPAT